jgi:hypothetical protein
MIKKFDAPGGPGDKGGGAPAPLPKSKQMFDPKYFHRSGGDTDTQFNVRDVIANFVARKDKNLSHPDAKSDYNYLVNQLGAPGAQKVMAHLSIFNQRPEIQNLPFEQRLSRLYTIGSNDKDVDGMLKQYAALGQGPVAAAYDSPNVTNMQAVGKYPATPVVALNRVMSK